MDGNQTPAGQPELPQPLQPGQTIAPASSPAPPVTPSAEPASPLAPATEPPQPTVTLPASVPSVPAPDSDTAVPITQFDGTAEADTPLPNSGGPVTWTASEFIAHEKNTNWYILLFGGAIIAAGITWIVTRDVTSSVVILLAVGVLAAYASRTPRELQYTLDDYGITIGEKHYTYTAFRSFSVIEEGPFSSIELLPLKRFAPPISVYYDPANEEAIAEALTPHLPFQPREQDPIDKLMRRIRF